MLPERQFLAWLAQNAKGFLRQLPEDIFTKDGLRLYHGIIDGLVTAEDIGAEPFSALEAHAYLKQILLARIGREIGRAQKTDDYRELERAVHQLTKIGSKDGIPLLGFDAIEPKLRDVIPTGIAPLDKQIRGLARGELGVVAMPAGRGKSLFLINVAVNAALDGKRVLYISVADAGIDELTPRIDSSILEEECPPDADENTLRERHRRALQLLPGRITIADFTDRTCDLADIEAAVEAAPSDLVIVDHADDIVPPWSDPAVTRHGLRAIYIHLKKVSVFANVPVWTASQTHEDSWFMPAPGLFSLAEAKTGKASGAAIVLVFSAGRDPVPGVMYATIAKARRHYTETTIPLRYSYPKVRIW